MKTEFHKTTEEKRIKVIESKTKHEESGLKCQEVTKIKRIQSIKSRNDKTNNLAFNQPKY